MYIEWVNEIHSVVSSSLQPHELCSLWNSPGQNTAVGSLSLIQEILQHRDRTQASRIVGRFFTTEPCGKLWPWTKHFVLLSFSSLTKTMGIILRYKWKGLEQHVIQRSLSINPNYPHSPSFHLLYLAPWNTLFEDGDLPGYKRRWGLVCTSVNGAQSPALPGNSKGRLWKTI